MDDTKAAAEVTMGKNKLAAWKLVLFCVDHITHHRGQTVVYLRLNGSSPRSIAPASSADYDHSLSMIPRAFSMSSSRPCRTPWIVRFVKMVGWMPIV